VVANAVEDFRFSDAADAAVVCAVILSIALLVLLLRVARGRGPGRTHVAIPSVVPVMHRSSWRCFVICRSCSSCWACRASRWRWPIRRPASRAKRSRTGAAHRAAGGRLDQHGHGLQVHAFKTQGESTFFTAVAGAEYFIKRRMNGPLPGPVALIQFGNQAYVVTPFTNDYENILLSVRLVSDRASGAGSATGARPSSRASIRRRSCSRRSTSSTRRAT
jgi:hypothetical protein